MKKIIFIVTLLWSLSSFAGIKGTITVNELDILEVTGDPALSGGTVASAGSLAIADDGYIYQKFGSGATEWLKIANESILQFHRFSPYPEFTTVANTTTQWTSLSKFLQYFEGTTSGQIIKLPNASTLQEGWSYKIWNSSSTSVTFQNFSSTQVCKVSPNGWTYISLRDNSTTAGAWSCVQASSIFFDNSTNGFTAVNVQSAIEEAKQTSEGFPRSGLLGTYNSSISNNQWLGPNELLPNTPFVVFPVKSKINEMTWSNQTANVQFRVTFRTVSKTGTIFYTLTVTSPNPGYGYVSGLSFTFNPGDTIWAQYLDDGTNMSDATITLWISRIP
jgi:hypothetical protein